jgi:hypothetical protein
MEKLCWMFRKKMCIISLTHNKKHLDKEISAIEQKLLSLVKQDQQ